MPAIGRPSTVLIQAKKKIRLVEEHLVSGLRMNLTKSAICLIVALFALCDCAGIERVNASRQSDSQLILRHSQLTRELSASRGGGSAERDVTLMETERDAIERELISRCEAGDKAACPDSPMVRR
jgi:hypothetical protein